MAMALHAAPDHAPVQHVQRRKQRGGAVPLVVMGHGAAPPTLERQAGLRAVERLNLALFIDREHHRMSGRVDIEANDVAQLGGEERIVGKLELTDTMRLQPVTAPDALDRTDADAARLGHRGSGPVRGLARRVGQGAGDHLLHLVRRKRWDARWSGLVAQQPIHAFVHEALLPAPDGGFGHAGLAHDRHSAEAGGAQQYNLRSPDVLLRAAAVAAYGDQPLAVRTSEFEAYPGAHAPDSHIAPSRWNPLRILPSGFIH